MKTLQESILGGGLEKDIKRDVEDIELFKHGVHLEKIHAYNNWKDNIDLDYIKKNLEERGITDDFTKLEKQYKLKRSKNAGTISDSAIDPVICYLMSIPLETIINYYTDKKSSDMVEKWIYPIIDNGNSYITVYPYGFYCNITLELKTKKFDNTLFIVMQVPKKEFQKYL